MRIQAASLLIFAAASMAQGGGAIIESEFASETLARPYHFNVYLPEGYENSGASYPVIYLLHGRGDNMSAWTKIKSDLDMLIAEDRVPPMIAVMPDFPSSKRAGYYVDSQYTGKPAAEQVETAFFDDLIPHIESAYRVMPERSARFIGGYSMGGYGALRYALAHLQFFAGALVLSPAVYFPLPPADSSAREFGAFGRGDMLFDEKIYTELNYRMLRPRLRPDMSMFITVGDDEWKNQRLEDALHDLDMEAHMFFNYVVRVPGVRAEFRVYDGGHDWNVWRRGLIEGLPFLTQKLKD